MQTVRVIICMMAVLHAARTSFWGWTLREVAADVCHREAQLFIWYLAAAPTRTQLWQGWYDFCELVPIIWQRVSIVWMRVRAPSYGHSHVSNANPFSDGNIPGEPNLGGFLVGPRAPNWAQSPQHKPANCRS